MASELNAERVLPEEFLKQLEAWGINLKTFEHEPAFTVEQSKHLKADIPGVHTKNLFLRSKKRAEYILIVLIGDDRLDLKQFSKEQGYSSGDLSFASDERLMQYLGVEPGHVTPFALINEASKEVNVILDYEMMQGELLNFHPLINSKTSSITRADFLKFLEKVHHKPKIMRLPKK